MSNPKFVCAGCNSTVLEEVMTNVHVSNIVEVINDDGHHEYGLQENNGGDFDRYQCHNCGKVLEHKDGGNVGDCTELSEWLLKNCPQD